MRTEVLLPVLFLVLAVIGCNAGESASPTAGEIPGEVGAMGMRITSTAFQGNDTIPAKYTCDGDDVSPPLQWESAPEGTKSFALIADDPDAPVGTWVHWIIYDMPAGATGLPEGVEGDGERADGSRHGKNSWNRLGYGGPCPPGGTHRYFFKLYALDSKLGLPAGAGVKHVMDAMEGHVLAQAELMGKYARK